MNFLAHIYLAGEDEELMIGNFIGDFVKGKNFEGYSDKVVEGIMHHRYIDSFTDSHEVVKKSIQRLRPFYGKFSGIAVDMFYDHFLAKNWEVYHPKDLHGFSQQVYQTLVDNKSDLPQQVQNFLPHMIAQNWLYNYANLDGLQRALEGIDGRTKFRSGLSTAVEQLLNAYAIFEEDFINFFPELQNYVTLLSKGEK